MKQESGDLISNTFSLRNGVDILCAAPLLLSLPGVSIDLLASKTRVRSLLPRSFLFHQGDNAEGIFVVGSGRLRLLQHTRDGVDVALELFCSGDVIGLAALLRETGFMGSCQAITGATVAELPAATFREVLNQSPVLMQRLLALLAARLAVRDDHIRELSSAHAEERLASALMRLADKVGVKEAGVTKIDLPITRQMLAEMCGLTLHSVSRLLSQWHRAGWVYAGREQLVLLVPDAVRALCMP